MKKRLVKETTSHRKNGLWDNWILVSWWYTRPEKKKVVMIFRGGLV
jgi:hypothetical protein